MDPSSLIVSKVVPQVAKDTSGLMLKALGPSADIIGEELAKRTRDFFNRNGTRAVVAARAKLEAAGSNEIPVPEKLLIPLIWGASQEGDDYLSEKWAALLASAADVDTQDMVHPAFAKILSELTPEEARVLDLVAARGGTMLWSEFRNQFEVEYGAHGVVAIQNNLSRLHLWSLASSAGNTGNTLKITAFGFDFLKVVRGPLPAA